MIYFFIGMFVITAIISYLWVRGIDKETEYRKKNPDYKPGEGWLDWDKKEK
jgi:hypothetical protein